MTRLIEFRTTGHEGVRLDEAAKLAGKPLTVYCRDAVVRKADEDLKAAKEAEETEEPVLDPVEGEETEPEAEETVEEEEVEEEEEAVEEETPELVEFCGDLGGRTMAGKPCRMKARQGKFRCSAHSEPIDD